MKKKNNSTFIAIIISGLIISGAILISGNENLANQNINQQIDSEERVVTDSRVNMDNIQLENWSSLGNPEAPVVMVEYSDFACPYCGRFFDETLPEIKENYIDSGEVFFIYKDLGVVGGDKAAEAAHCAGEQDSYWEYHDLLFERSNQDRGRWSDSSTHAGYAEELSLNKEMIVTCFEEARYSEKVQNSTDEAISLGITGTPGFVINGEIVKGAQPYQVFEQIIEEKLSN
jgi:protein-disulfide isomerase